MVTLFWGLAIYIAFVFLLDIVVDLLAGAFAWAGRHEARIRAGRLAN
ncbi:MAG: hypothetical protein O9320_06690 [Magnetospirillum sp.]|jgi:hypothetical protein|nr:hypothetical protein [Magnetospirillum sp.]